MEVHHGARRPIAVDPRRSQPPLCHPAAAAVALRIGGPFVSNLTLTAEFLRPAPSLVDCRTGRACDTALSTYAQNHVSTCHLSVCLAPNDRVRFATELPVCEPD
jgi:hypothetical protein